MRVTFYMRFFQIFFRRIGQSKIRSFAAFKVKKFYLGFRPVQKLKSHAIKKRKEGTDAAREAQERLKNMLLEKTKVRLALNQLLPKSQKEEEPPKGIVAALVPSDVTVLTISPKDGGLKETVYKVYCGYNIEGERFFHAIHSKHIVVAEDLFDVDIDSCDLAESVEYQGYGSDSEGGEVSDSSALI